MQCFNNLRDLCRLSTVVSQKKKVLPRRSVTLFSGALNITTKSAAQVPRAPVANEPVTQFQLAPVANEVAAQLPRVPIANEAATQLTWALFATETPA